MSPVIEKRLLQALLAVAMVLPITAAVSGIVYGPEFLDRHGALARDLDSHFRYINGLFFGILCWYASCIPAIERHGPRLRLLGSLVIFGGLMRALSWGLVGPPSLGHKIGLGIELVIVPIVLLWQARLARRFT
ncbi:DUF4345 domain-containing protein [Sphingomonas sp.]|jgi:hypothetical protein|uniref:DUF4345 domain-containing protein n=1 Tax=Sphingomonas sp. TaxID=28214 RepID=UPI002ED7D207